MATIQGDPGGSVMGWQGDGIDVEIETVYTRGGKRRRWVLYDHAHLIDSGTRRTRMGARLRGAVAAALYRRCRR